MKRESNFELLRIIAMLMIITFHVQQKIVAEDPMIYKFFLRTIGSGGGVIGVTLFVMIFAWFSVDDFNSNKAIIKVVSTIIHTVWYLLGFLGAYLIYSGISGKNILKSLIECEINGIMEPFWMARYWFVTAYIFLVLLAPVLNKMLHSISIRELRFILLIFAIILIAAPFLNIEISYIKDIVMFIFIYTLTAYIKWGKAPILNTKYYLIISAILLFVIVFANGIHIFLPESIGNVLEISIGYTGRYSVPLILSAAALFIFFSGINVKYCKWINSIAALTFDVYLFHENPVMNITRYLYGLNLFDGIKKLIVSIGIVPVLFIGGCIIGILTRKSLGGIETKLTKKITGYLYMNGSIL